MVSLRNINNPETESHIQVKEAGFRIVDPTISRVLRVFSTYYVGCMLVGLFLSSVLRVLLLVALPPSIAGTVAIDSMAQILGFLTAGIIVFRMVLGTRFGEFRVAFIAFGAENTKL